MSLAAVAEGAAAGEAAAVALAWVEAAVARGAACPVHRLRWAVPLP